MRIRLQAAAFGLAAVLSSPEVQAAEPCAPLERGRVVACALSASPELQEERASQSAAEGRREAVRPLLPSNPVLSGSLAARTGPGQNGLNWNLSLGQELELAGQRGLRVEAAEHEVSAQAHRLSATRATVAARAWSAWFTVLAAKERARLAEKLQGATATVASTVHAMVAGGLASEVEADIADAAALRAAQERLSLEGLAAASTAQLGLLVGTAQGLDVHGALEPLGVPAHALPAADRPELRALHETEAAFRRRADALARQTIPNPTLALFAQRDGFDEHVFGVGLSFPIPLPEPVGRTLAGEQREALALADKAAAEATRAQRTLDLALAAAQATHQAAAGVRALYTPERLGRAEARLESVAVQVKAGRLAVRDALAMQQALVEQLKADIDAREALCHASVELVRAAGLSLEGASP